MNYVYDILLNFKEDFIDFYDWNTRDGLDHIRKIPIFKVETKVLRDFIDYSIELDRSELEKIENQTEIFLGRKVKNIRYACLLTDYRKVLALKLKDKKMYISDLLLDEEDSSLDMTSLLPLWDLKYQKLEKRETNCFKTRKQLAFEKSLYLELQKLMNENNLSKLKYIYYECFDEKEEKKEVMLHKINLELKENFSNFSKKIDHLLKITNTVI